MALLSKLVPSSDSLCTRSRGPDSNLQTDEEWGEERLLSLSEIGRPSGRASEGKQERENFNARAAAAESVASAASVGT